MGLAVVGTFLQETAPVFPRYGMGVAVVALAFLLVGAFSDALSGRIPNKSVFLGGLCVLGGLIVEASWRVMVVQVGLAVCLGFALWAVNELYFAWQRHDAIGFGDVKWSVLASLAFGVQPVLWTWPVAAWLALGWMGIRRHFPSVFIKKQGNPALYLPVPYVHFSPFLFFGLLGVLVVRFLS